MSNTMPTLYTISGDLSAILNEIEANGGEITPALEQALAITETQFTEKAADYGLAILNLRAMAAAAKAEKDRLAGLQKFYENTEKRLCAAISSAMQSFDRPKVETPVVRLFLRHTQTTEIDDIAALPKRFKTTKIEEVADKTAIKNAIQAGETVEGAHLNDNYNLQIK